MKTSMFFGNMCHTASLASLVRPPMRRVQPSLELKPLLPFSLFPGCNEMDHVHKALVSPSFGMASPLKMRPSSCGVCRLRFNSEIQASSHYRGTKHATRLKAPDAPDCKTSATDTAAKETSASPPCPLPPISNSDGTAGAVLPPTSASGAALLSCSPAISMETTSDPPLSPCPCTEKVGEVEEEEAETEEEKAKRLLYCSLCKVAVNSASQLQAHNSGTKHKTMLEARSGEGAIKSFPRSGVKAKRAVPAVASTGLQNKTFHCEICDVHVNSETQLKQHISSRRHKDRAAGKPAKPKFSPHGTTQRNQTLQAVQIALRKEQPLGKPLASCLLQHHLSVTTAAAMATLSPFHLRHTSTPNHTLFPPQPLPQALLHPAPGPLRMTHTSVLFSPY